MPGRIGADPEALDTLAAQLRGFSDTLHSTQRHLSSGVHERAWKGARADRFRSDWDHLYVPWIDGACEWLERAVTELHDNANQQRVASGEAPKDYSTGWTRFTHDLGHGVGEFRDITKEAWEIGRKAVGSEAFDHVLGVLDVVSTVAGVVAIFPIPVVQEAAAVVAISAGAAVMVGHLLQNANQGRFNARQFATDGLGVAGGALGKMGRASARSADEAAKVMGEGSYFARNAKDIDNVWKSVSDSNLLSPNGLRSVGHAVGLDTQVGVFYKMAQVATVPVRVGTAMGDQWDVTSDVYDDVSQGDFGEAAHDLLLGEGKVFSGLAGYGDVRTVLDAQQKLDDFEAGSAGRGGGGGGW